MLTMKKRLARESVERCCGPWKGWGRAQHLAYGLLRGVAYERMERCANDNPLAVPLVRVLLDAGAFGDVVVSLHAWIPREIQDEVERLVVWVRKPPRVARENEAA